MTDGTGQLIWSPETDLCTYQHVLKEPRFNLKEFCKFVILIKQKRVKKYYLKIAQNREDKR